MTSSFEEKLIELCKLARRANRYCLIDSNESLTAKQENNSIKLDNEIKGLLKELGVTKYELNGDPRGHAVKIILPNGRSNNMGGEDWEYLNCKHCFR